MSQILFRRTKSAPTPSTPTRLANPKKSVSLNFKNEITRPSPFLISDEELNPQGYIEKKYGENTIRVHGKLREKDRQTLITLLAIYKTSGKHPLNLKISDIAKAGNIKNPYNESTLQPIRESIDRLKLARIEINPGPSRLKRNSATFIFLHGWRRDDDTCQLFLADYLNTALNFGIGFYIQPAIYYELSSDIAKALFCFLQSQRMPYTIRLAKLCEFINYDPAGQPWKKIWQTVDKALKQLLAKGIIGKYTRDGAKLKEDGGLITIEGPGRKTLDVANPYVDMANRLAEVLQKAKGIKTDQRKVNFWANNIKSLVEDKGVVIGRIEAALLWYEEFHNREFTPQIASGKDLLEKFPNLEDAVQRHKKELWRSNQIDPDRESFVVFLPDEVHAFASKYEYSEPTPPKPKSPPKPQPAPPPAKKAEQQSSRCPFGGAFGEDCNGLENCDSCPAEIWKQCQDEYDRKNYTHLFTE